MPKKNENKVEETKSKADWCRLAVEQGHNTFPAARDWLESEHNISITQSNFWSATQAKGERKNGKKNKGGMSADQMLTLHRIGAKVTADDMKELVAILDACELDEVLKVLGVLQSISAPPGKSK